MYFWYTFMSNHNVNSVIWWKSKSNVANFESILNLILQWQVVLEIRKLDKISKLVRQESLVHLEKILVKANSDFDIAAHGNILKMENLIVMNSIIIYLEVLYHKPIEDVDNRQ